MTEPSEPVPPALRGALNGVPKSLVPATLKALDRLIGGAIDIPAAWLAQQKSKIDAQTEAYRAVESAIAKAAATEAGGDPVVVARAVEVLVRKSYREQKNRESVAAATVEALEITHSTSEPLPDEAAVSNAQPDEEWLNVFEQYAERASTDRMQKLWGRVLAGEIRRPGQFSMRTLRFLSEFSQADALRFAEFAQFALGDAAPKKLVKEENVRPLIDLEAAGLISGATGLGLSRTYRFNERGWAWSAERNLLLMLEGEPAAQVKVEIVVLTPLGQELLALIPDRCARDCARRFAEAIREPSVKRACLATLLPNGQAAPFESLWDLEAERVTESQ